MKGLSYLEVEVSGPNRDLHSGLYGGAVANPINILCQMIGKMKDANNYITIPDFYKNVIDLSDEERSEIARKAARYSGLSERDFIDNNLDVTDQYFWKKLLYDEGYILGRLDSRYRGIDKKNSGVSVGSYPELDAWDHAFTPAMQDYLKNDLRYETNMNYNVWGNVRPWNRDNDRTGDNLRQAMAKNPFLNVMIQSGYYDGATQYFDAKYTMWHIDPSGKMKDRLSFKGYESGHMMYLRREDLKNSNDDIREFIRNTIPSKPAKY